MAKLPRSPIAQDVRNNYQPVREARMSDADPVGRALQGAGDAGFEIANRMADAKIAVEGAKAETALQSRLDAEKRLLETATDIEPEELEARFRERAAAIVSEEAGRMTSPALKRAFGQLSGQKVESYSIQMRDVTRRKQVARIDSELLSLADSFQKTTEDPNSYFKDPSTGEPSVAEITLANAMSAIDRSAGILDEDVVKERKLRLQAAYDVGLTNMHVKNVERRLEAGNFAAAESYFRDNSKEISKAEQDKVEEVIRIKTREGGAITKADELFAAANGDYGTAITEAYKIPNPDERLAVESRLAQLKNQGDAAKLAADQALLEEGMGFIVEGRSLPSDLLRRASPMVIDRLQTEQRTRALWAQQMATATAQEKAAMREMSRGNYYRLKAQLNDPELAAAGFNAILADPALNALYENMTADEQGQFYNDVAAATKGGGAPADAVSKAYKSVVNLASAYMPENLSPKDYGKYFGGVGEGDPGVAYISANRKKPDAALVFEGELMRLVDEEMARTGGADIQADRAKQLVALAYAKAGEKKDGTTKYPISQDIAAGAVQTDMRRIALDFRQQNPAIWREATTLVRSQYPNASDELVLEEARRIEQRLATIRSGRGELGRFPME